MDWLILVGFACVPLVALLGILLGLLWSSERCPVSKVCLVARVENWSLASLAGGEHADVDGWFQNVETYKGLTRFNP